MQAIHSATEHNIPAAGQDAALWRLPEVLRHYPVSRAGWLAGVAAGRYPASVRLGVRCVAWRSTDIRTLIASL